MGTIVREEGFTRTNPDFSGDLGQEDGTKSEEGVFFFVLHLKNQVENLDIRLLQLCQIY